MTPVHVLLLLLLHICTYFSLQTPAQKYFLPQGAGYPSYAAVITLTVTEMRQRYEVVCLNVKQAKWHGRKINADAGF